jgi:hypothetical protein
MSLTYLFFWRKRRNHFGHLQVHYNSRRNYMYLSTAEVLGIIIALSSSIFIMVLTTIANYRLQQDNKLLRNRLKANRMYWEARVNN